MRSFVTPALPKEKNRNELVQQVRGTLKRYATLFQIRRRPATPSELLFFFCFPLDLVNNKKLQWFRMTFYLQVLLINGIVLLKHLFFSMCLIKHSFLYYNQGSNPQNGRGKLFEHVPR